MTAAIHNADCVEFMATMPDSCVDAVITDPPYGLSFMGKGWDHSVPGPAYWSEALRVSKPGAHLLCFGGARTFHRMACAIEDAGWEIRDCIMWVYGSGFPKSLDVAKAIDKADGFVGEVIGENKASEWQGWGTCLKPAWEPIIVARKPLDGTVASNVMEHGTGAMNIDACRVPTDETWTRAATPSAPFGKRTFGGGRKRIEQHSHDVGRFPANLVHDGSDEVIALFPESKSSKQEQSTITRREGSGWGMTLTGTTYEDEGSAARFFYCAKASAEDRGEGNDHPTVKPRALMEWLVKLVTTRDATVLDPFCGSGSTLVAAAGLGRGCIGIERDPHYCEIAERRLARAEDEFAGTIFSLGMEGV